MTNLLFDIDNVIENIDTNFDLSYFKTISEELINNAILDELKEEFYKDSIKVAYYREGSLTENVK